jgi:hypothetical protein
MTAMLPATTELVLATRATRRLGSPHRCTVHRWILRGLKGASGEVVKLRAWRFGSRWMTTQEAVDEFVQAITTPGEPAAPPRTVAERQRANEETLRELHALGMKSGRDVVPHGA